MDRLTKHRATFGLASFLTLGSVAVSAQEGGKIVKVIDDFVVDMVEVYDEHENYVDLIDVSDVEGADVKILDEKVGMLLVRFRDSEYWIFDSDVILAGRKTAIECRSVSRAGE
ncbi:MAG: hypothetical protein AAGC55_26000, partial [Myxococcota bacterium]